ncbi:DMT family transporter [Romboutsia weinsteinii]|uniref:DMT family transporter n=1 Tax=Romboutsia weinsteinii TaxID=2020949 RepID=A0A371J585_9FIRM|nr:DMT family transporter [Romboutsia weinsteinii]RDY27847.1 DMT family transporter [Romboutsia weinsteinii]
MIYIIIAVLSGFTIVTSRSVNSILAEKIGMYQSTFFNYVLGLTGSLILLFISGETLRLFSFESYDATWFYYTGGLVGVVSVTLSSYLALRVSSFYLTLLIFIGQLFTGIVLDYIAIGSISIYQVIGGVLVVIGLAYNLFIDNSR